MKYSTIRKAIEHARLFVSEDNDTWYCCEWDQLLLFLATEEDFFIKVETDPSNIGVFVVTANWYRSCRDGTNPSLDKEPAVEPMAQTVKI